jgi:hypothetical protein
LEDEYLKANEKDRQLQIILMEFRAARDELHVRCQELVRETQALQMDKRELTPLLPKIKSTWTRGSLRRLPIFCRRRQTRA